MKKRKVVKFEDMFVPVQEEEKECVHNIWAKGFPFTLIGYSDQEKLALLFCETCSEQFWIEFDMHV